MVADEMGKLAKDSGGSATEIKSTLNIITNHIITIISSIKDANSLAKEHIENISAIQKTLGEMRNLSGKLEQDIHNQ